jgi:hypothetical protein
VLIGLYPTQVPAVDSTHQNDLRDKGLSGDASLAVGAEVAAKVPPLRRRTDDSRSGLDAGRERSRSCRFRSRDPSGPRSVANCRFQ